MPLKWISAAKAVRTSSVHDRAFFRIQAGDFNDAHQIILDQIAPKAILDEDHEFLYELLNELNESQRDITGITSFNFETPCINVAR